MREEIEIVVETSIYGVLKNRPPLAPPKEGDKAKVLEIPLYSPPKEGLGEVSGIGRSIVETSIYGVLILEDKTF